MIHRLANYITSWRLSLRLARNPEWNRQIAESAKQWDEFVKDHQR